MFRQRGDSFALIGFSTAMCGSFRWQGDTCLSLAALSEYGLSGEGPLFLWFYAAWFIHHTTCLPSGLWALFMCCYVRCYPTPCGLELENVALS